MFTYLETAIAFTLVMLVASLMVKILVRLYDAATYARARAVQDMLRQLYRGFARTVAGNPFGPQNEDDFVHAILSAPALNSAASPAWTATPAAKKMPKAHSTIQYLLKEDVCAIIKEIPETEVGSWFPGSRTDAAALKLKEDFAQYIRRWFPTAAATSSNSFGRIARRKAMSVAAIVVIALNLDAIRLAYDLYRDRMLDGRINQHVGDMTETAKRIVASDEDGKPDDKQQLLLDLQKTSAFFSVERVPIGWNDSYISKRWCAYHDKCDDTAVVKPTRRQLSFDALYWLIGLCTSWLLLSLGAPFWVRTIETLTGVRDKLKPSSDKPGPKSPPTDPAIGGPNTEVELQLLQFRAKSIPLGKDKAVKPDDKPDSPG